MTHSRQQRLRKKDITAFGAPHRKTIIFIMTVRCWGGWWAVVNQIDGKKFKSSSWALCILWAMWAKVINTKLCKTALYFLMVIILLNVMARKRALFCLSLLLHHNIMLVDIPSILDKFTTRSVTQSTDIIWSFTRDCFQ